MRCVLPYPRTFIGVQTGDRFLFENPEIRGQLETTAKLLSEHVHVVHALVYARCALNTYTRCVYTVTHKIQLHNHYSYVNRVQLFISGVL
jgi:hypothetical protein